MTYQPYTDDAVEHVVVVVAVVDDDGDFQLWLPDEKFTFH